MRLIAAQCRFPVGAVAANADRIVAVVLQAMADGDDDTLVIFPELAICGYPPEDLLLRRDFVAAAMQAADAVAKMNEELAEIN